MEINGTIESEITPTSFEFNGMTTIPKIILFEDGCLNSLPEEEFQTGVYFDTYGCASFSFNNCLETDGERRIELGLYSADNTKWLQDNMMINGKLNFSDRDTVVKSLTNPDWGNSSWQIFSLMSQAGLICESDAPWDFRSRDPKINNKANYYNYIRSTESDAKAKEFLKRFEIKAEWVNRENWLEASKYGVIQVYTRAWFKRPGTDKYYNPTPNASGHGIMLAQKSTEKIFDQYDPFIKQMERDEDFYPDGFKLSLIEKTMTKPIIKDNTLVQLIYAGPGGGGFGLFLSGKIRVGDTAGILATFYMRNNGDTKGKTLPLTKEQWDMFEKVSL